MSPNMHTWIATALATLTVHAVLIWPKIKDVKTEHEMISFSVQFISPFIFIIIWHYLFVS